MKKKKEAKHLANEWKQMNAHLEAFLESGSQEELHSLRVQIKRLKAMLSLLENTSDQHRLLKHFKPVKRIFKYAGLIREAHINLQLSDRYDIKNELFETGQQKIIQDGTVKFQHRGKEYLKSLKAAYRHLKNKLPKVKDSEVAEFYKKQLEQIAVNFTVSGFDEDMHTNRKLIKILVYNHKLADKALKGAFHFNGAYLDDLQSAIGNWHDNMVAARLFSLPELNDKPVVSKINRKNAGIKHKITQLADDFLKKATAADAAVQ